MSILRDLNPLDSSNSPLLLHLTWSNKHILLIHQYHSFIHQTEFFLRILFVMFNQFIENTKINRKTINSSFKLTITRYPNWKHLYCTSAKLWKESTLKNWTTDLKRKNQLFFKLKFSLKNQSGSFCRLPSIFYIEEIKLEA